MDCGNITPKPTWNVSDVWRTVELNDELNFNDPDDPKGLDALWDWIGSGCRNPLPRRWFPDAGSLYFRGQVSQAYALTSALFRVVAERNFPVSEKAMAAAERAVIDAARSQGIGRRMTDLELLVVLQHHHVPTRLMDFSLTPYEALYFAVEGRDEVDGRFFIANVPNGATALKQLAQDRGLISASDDGRPKGLPWLDAFRGEEKAEGRWTAMVAQVDAGPLDPRLQAQNGTFLVGGVMTGGAGRYQPISETDVTSPKEDLQRVASIAIHFSRGTGAGMNKAHGSWPAYGWTVRVPKEWKAELRRRLANIDEPITPDSIYPPIDESRRLLVNALKSARG